MTKFEFFRCWVEESYYMWILKVPVIMILICSLVFLVNIVRVLITKLHPKSLKPAPLAIKKAVRATLILVWRHLIISRSKITNFFLDSTFRTSTHFTSLSTWKRFVFRATLSARISSPHKSAGLLRLLSLLLRQPWGIVSGFLLSQQLVPENIPDVLSRKLLRSSGHHNTRCYCLNWIRCNCKWEQVWLSL